MATSSENKAKAALVQALLKKDALDHRGVLEITWPHDRETVEALIALMTDVTAEDWEATPLTGYAHNYRQYSGTLPCGLRVDVVTNVEDVAPIDCTTP